MKARKKAKAEPGPAGTKTHPAPRNGRLHIPLDFETAVEGLLNVKPKKKPPKK
jgi:hypothetical protein